MSLLSIPVELFSVYGKKGTLPSRMADQDRMMVETPVKDWIMTIEIDLARRISKLCVYRNIEYANIGTGHLLAITASDAMCCFTATEPCRVDDLNFALLIGIQRDAYEMIRLKHGNRPRAKSKKKKKLA